MTTGYFESIEHSRGVQSQCLGPIPYSSFGTDVLELEGHVALPVVQILLFYTSLRKMSAAKLTNPLWQADMTWFGWS